MFKKKFTKLLVQSFFNKTLEKEKASYDTFNLVFNHSSAYHKFLQLRYYFFKIFVISLVSIFKTIITVKILSDKHGVLCNKQLFL